MRTGERKLSQTAPNGSAGHGECGGASSFIGAASSRSPPPVGRQRSSTSLRRPASPPAMVSAVHRDQQTDPPAGAVDEEGMRRRRPWPSRQTPCRAATRRPRQRPRSGTPGRRHARRANPRRDRERAAAGGDPVVRASVRIDVRVRPRTPRRRPPAPPAPAQLAHEVGMQRRPPGAPRPAPLGAVTSTAAAVTACDRRRMPCGKSRPARRGPARYCLADTPRIHVRYQAETERRCAGTAARHAAAKLWAIEPDRPVNAMPLTLNPARRGLDRAPHAVIALHCSGLVVESLRQLPHAGGGATPY